MKISLLESEGIQTGCVLRVQIGHVQAQASISTDDHSDLIFPGCEPNVEPVRVDVLALLGSASLSLDPNSDHYTVDLQTPFPASGDSSHAKEPMRLLLKVSDRGSSQVNEDRQQQRCPFTGLENRPVESLDERMRSAKAILKQKACDMYTAELKSRCSHAAITSSVDLHKRAREILQEKAAQDQRSFSAVIKDPTFGSDNGEIAVPVIDTTKQQARPVLQPLLFSESEPSDPGSPLEVSSCTTSPGADSGWKDSKFQAAQEERHRRVRFEPMETNTPAKDFFDKLPSTVPQERSVARSQSAKMLPPSKIASLAPCGSGGDLPAAPSDVVPKVRAEITSVRKVARRHSSSSAVPDSLSMTLPCLSAGDTEAKRVLNTAHSDRSIQTRMLSQSRSTGNVTRANDRAVMPSSSFLPGLVQSAGDVIMDSGRVAASADREVSRRPPQVPHLNIDKIQQQEDKKKLESLQAKVEQMKTKLDPTDTSDLRELPIGSDDDGEQSSDPMDLLRAQLAKLAAVTGSV